MKIAVIGTGYVGLTMICLAKYGHEIILIGRTKEKIDDLNKGVLPIYEPGLDAILAEGLRSGKILATSAYGKIKEVDAVFLCVGTPSKEDGSIDLSQIETAAADVAKQLDEKYRVVVVKSTVVPGTTKSIVLPILEKTSGKKLGSEFGLCMNPEFLKEGTGVDDFLKPDKVVIGCNDDRAYSVVQKLYESYDEKIPRIKTDLNTAEMIKYAQNSMLASRISFINEIANICERVNVDVNEVAKAIGIDSRIGPAFLKAGCGFGGSCFPKDVKALRALSSKLGVTPTMLDAILKVNEKQPMRMIELTKNAIGELKNKKIAVLGLAFKPDTDDMRESPTITVINALLGEGAEVKTYDPKAIGHAQKIFGDRIKYCTSKEECLKNVDVCLILTDWDEFKNMDVSAIGIPVIDGRRAIDPKIAESGGFVYKGIGWKKN